VGKKSRQSITEKITLLGSCWRKISITLIEGF
jgi:hypothetical protein